MEYASGGELFERICAAGRFDEHEVFKDSANFLREYVCGFQIQCELA